MTHHIHHRGEAHTVVIIVLVVALIGTLGYVFWQNFSKKNGDETQQVTSSQSTTDRPNSVGTQVMPDVDIDEAAKRSVEDKKSDVMFAYSIDEWRLGTVEASGMRGVSYRIEDKQGYGIAYFEGRNGGEDCSFAAITRFDPDANMKDFDDRYPSVKVRDYKRTDAYKDHWRKIGTHYYKYTPQTHALCGMTKEDGNMQRAKQEAIQKFFSNLTEK